MRLLFALLLPFSVVGDAQSLLPIDSGQPEIHADKILRTDSFLRGMGNARVKLGALVLQADEATLNSDTSNVELRGHVCATLPAQTGGHHTIFRYGPGTLVTDKPVLVFADTLTVKHGLLQASGNITVKTAETDSAQGQRLQADDMIMYLRTADAEVRGNIRTNIQPPKRASFPTFPPDIIR